MLKLPSLLLFSLLCISTVFAKSTTVHFNLIDDKGIGKDIGTITIEDSSHGIILTPALNNLPPGVHGFQIYQNPSCSPAMKDGKLTAGIGAGNHYDPHITSHHEGPYGHGHKGDLPDLYVEANGSSTIPLLAPRLNVNDLYGHAIIIHASSDYYSDASTKLSNDRDRIACGIVKKERGNCILFWCL
jgi:superoxide dismutase, Cu-Zn family